MTYTVPGFLEKNGDTLTEDLIELLRTSGDRTFIFLWPVTLADKGCCWTDRVPILATTLPTFGVNICKGTKALTVISISDAAEAAHGTSVWNDCAPGVCLIVFSRPLLF